MAKSGVKSPHQYNPETSLKTSQRFARKMLCKVNSDAEEKEPSKDRIADDKLQKILKKAEKNEREEETHRSIVRACNHTKPLPEKVK